MDLVSQWSRFQGVKLPLIKLQYNSTYQGLVPLKLDRSHLSHKSVQLPILYDTLGLHGVPATEIISRTLTCQYAIHILTYVQVGVKHCQSLKHSFCFLFSLLTGVWFREVQCVGMISVCSSLCRLPSLRTSVLLIVILSSTQYIARHLTADLCTKIFSQASIYTLHICLHSCSYFCLQRTFIILDQCNS